jgi:hypothetical protein
MRPIFYIPLRRSICYLQYVVSDMDKKKYTGEIFLPRCGCVQFDGYVPRVRRKELLPFLRSMKMGLLA